MTEAEPLIRSEEELAEEADFQALYGAWDAFDPAAAREFFDGFDRPWWVVGGWSIDAFTGMPREHEDIDVSILARDVAALRAHVGERWHLWNAFDGALRPVTDRHPELVSPESQIWVRRDASSPWVLDIPITPDRDGLWTNKRLADHAVPVEDATWVTDGIRYLNPEITLLFKARLARPKDHRDFAKTWTMLSVGQQSWLSDAVQQLYPDHEWLERM